MVERVVKRLTELPGFSDEAKRMHNIVQGYIAFIEPWELKNKWLAVRLRDGGTDGTLYDTMEDAIKHQSDEFLCAYFSYLNCLGGGITVKECEIWLDFVRKAYKAGFRLPDPSAQFGGSQSRLQPFMNVEQFDIRTGRDARTQR